METWGQGKPGAFELILPPGHKTVALGSPGLAGPLATFSKNETPNLDTSWSLSTPTETQRPREMGAISNSDPRAKGVVPSHVGTDSLLLDLWVPKRSHVYI